MANKALFGRRSSRSIKPADTINEAGGKAYSQTAKEALATLAVTGTFNNTFYANAEDQLKTLADLLGQVEPEFIAKVAIYARESGFMKDMPAYMVAYLMSSDLDSVLLERTFNTVIDNSKMMRNFVQIMRSGQIGGRKSMGSRPKRLVQSWLNRRKPTDLVRDMVGNDPSLADVIKMVHPRPISDEQGAMYRYILNGTISNLLPTALRQYEDWKNGERGSVPKVPFLMLTSHPMTTADWIKVIPTMGWHALRMNLNTLQRNGVFNNEDATQMVCDRLRDREEILRSKVFPYQILAAYKHAVDLPTDVTLALQDALEIATENVPDFGSTAVLVDISSSMDSPITGSRGTASSKIRCVDVAALIASSILRQNARSTMIGFREHAVDLKLNSRDSVMTNANAIQALCSGGTNLTAGLDLLESKGKALDTVIIVSDNMSWLDGTNNARTGAANVWARIQKDNPNAKLICIDLQPYTTVQVPNSKNVLNIAGFSDSVFEIIQSFCDKNRDFVGTINKTKI